MSNKRYIVQAFAYPNPDGAWQNCHYFSDYRMALTAKDYLKKRSRKNVRIFDREKPDV